MFSFADDDEEYEDNNKGFNLGFIFGNVDNSGDLDADYLDEVIYFYSFSMMALLKTYIHIKICLTFTSFWT